MVGDYAVIVEGLSDLAKFDEIPDKIMLAAQRAVNATTKRARARGAKEIRSQVNFPAQYLSESEGRLRVSKFATKGDLEGKVTARSRPTSLARFATSTVSPGSRGGVHLSVKPGSATFMRRAFGVKLKAGTADIDTKFNLGLAIRLRAGETLHNKTKFKQFKAGKKSSIYLLYGPSVDQVFKSVSREMMSDVEEYLEAEFVRLVDLKL